MDDNIISVLARVYVDDLDGELPLYEELTGDDSPLMFSHDGVRLAKVGAFLLLQGADAEVRAHVATVNVHDMGRVVEAVARAGGELLEGPDPGPNGPRLVARHPDGNVVEYVQLTNG
ncbi:MAG: VOC family protein [Bifidobacterium sp.]|uniref:VOC family protein n=1 Tax=Bifidobacterium sp. TaxID=41200 RepID=UPI0039E85912